MDAGPTDPDQHGGISDDVRVTCGSCGFEDDWAVGAFSAHLLAIGGSAIWSEVRHRLRCRRFGCGSPDLTLAMVPALRRPANMPRRLGELDRRLIDAAMTILSDAARSKAGAVATVEVRLALLVVHRYARDRDAAALYWRRASTASRHVSESLRDPLDRLQASLVRSGWLAPDILIQPMPTWPWNSPAPPSWRAQSGGRHKDKEG